MSHERLNHRGSGGAALATTGRPGHPPAHLAAPRISRAAARGVKSLCAPRLARLKARVREHGRLTDSAPAAQPQRRVLATVLFTDIVESTASAATLGDTRWRQLLDHHDHICHSTIAQCAGRFVKATGDGMLATFDAPGRALRCATTLRAQLADSGILIRAGLHTAEVELRDGDVSGIGVHIASRVNALADSGEVLVSRTVRDLLVGSEHAFTSRGVHQLRGVPDEWELLAVGAGPSYPTRRDPSPTIPTRDPIAIAAPALTRTLEAASRA